MYKLIYHRHEERIQNVSFVEQSDTKLVIFQNYEKLVLSLTTSYARCNIFSKLVLKPSQNKKDQKNF